MSIKTELELRVENLEDRGLTLSTAINDLCLKLNKLTNRVTLIESGNNAQIEDIYFTLKNIQNNLSGKQAVIKQRAERNRERLTIAEKQDIRRLYAEGKLSIRRIADIYKRSHTTIHKVLKSNPSKDYA